VLIVGLNVLQLNNTEVHNVKTNVKNVLMDGTYKMTYVSNNVILIDTLKEINVKNVMSPVLLVHLLKNVLLVNIHSYTITNVQMFVQQDIMPIQSKMNVYNVIQFVTLVEIDLIIVYPVHPEPIYKTELVLQIVTLDSLNQVMELVNNVTNSVKNVMTIQSQIVNLVNLDIS